MEILESQFNEKYQINIRIFIINIYKKMGIKLMIQRCANYLIR